MISSLTSLQSTFPSGMEDIMFKQFTTNNDWMAINLIYHNWSTNLLVDKKRQYSSFSESDYVLSCHQPMLTVDDINTICKYHDNFNTFLSQVITFIKQANNNNNSKCLLNIHITIKAINSVKTYVLTFTYFYKPPSIYTTLYCSLYSLLYWVYKKLCYNLLLPHIN